MQKLALLVMSALLSTAPAYALLENAIKDNNEKLVGIYLNMPSTKLSAAQKADFLEKAHAQVEKYASKQGWNFNLATELDILTVTASTLGMAAGAISIYNSVRDDAKTNKDKYYWGSLAGAGLFLTGVLNTLKGVGEFRKHINETNSKQKRALRRAQNIVALLEAYPAR